LLDKYIRNVPLDGDVYVSDARSVHLYLMKLICGNKVAEQKVLPTRSRQDGWVDFQALMHYYEGVGANKISIREAEKDICNLYYTGERQPHMWWSRFESKIVNAFAIVDKEYGYSVYPDLAKLKILQRMIRCGSLKTIKATINYQMSIKERTIDFNTALVNYRNAVDSNISNNINTKRNHRNIALSVSTLKSSEGMQEDRKGLWTVNGVDGKEMKVHPSIRFSRQQWFNIPIETRKNTKRNHRNLAVSVSTLKSSEGTQEDRKGSWTVNGIDGKERKVHPSIRFSRLQRFNIPIETRKTLKQMRDEYKAKRYKQNKRSVKEVNIGSNGKESVNQEGEQEHKSLMGGKTERLRSKNISNIRSRRIIVKDPGTIATNEADTNADTCCLGSNFIALSQSNRSAHVHPYSDDSITG